MDVMFKGKSGNYGLEDFSDVLSAFPLEGKCVFCYSRLMSFGRINGAEAVNVLIDHLLERVGPEGTLAIPAYTFSGYKDETFDPETTPCRVGILGESARKRGDFSRTVHPVYATLCKGKRTEFLMTQDPTTCFGDGSFFELLTRIPESYLLLLGGPFSLQTLWHHYDQRFKAPGRFLKEFNAKMKTPNGVEEITFDAYVRDYDYYGDRINCLGPFDALVTELGLVDRAPFAYDWIHGIPEKTFRDLLEIVRDVDYDYFTITSMDEMKSYHLGNKFKHFHGALDPEKVERVRSLYAKK